MNIIDDIGIEPIYKAVCNDKYSKGTADYTPSSLNQPAYQRRLMRNHETQEKASDMIFALLGTSVHHMVELASEGVGHYVSEKRYYGDVETKYGVKSVGAQVDLYDTENYAIYDMKVTSAYSVLRGEPKPDWVAQLNVCRWCIHQHLHESPESLTIVAIIRDWSKMKAKDPDYPQQQVVKVEIPVWTYEQTGAWIKARINLIEKYLASDLKDCEGCSDDEVWARPTVWAVMKKGNKRAVKLCDTKEDAESRVTASNLYVEERKGERIRCASYCSVSQHCPFA